MEPRQMIDSADEADVRDATASLRIEAFPPRVSMYPPGSTESEKLDYLLGLFRMALRPEDDL